MARKRKITEDNYKIEFVDRILDPVHGFIDLTQVEKEIIELPIFKRMQSLKQLSLTNWVFPGAEHTRYMHSLGVMYIVDLMAMNLKDSDYNLKYNDGERQLLRLAGLLHDIGHYPLSHVTEYVYNDNLLGQNGGLLAHNKGVKYSIDKLSDAEDGTSDYMKDRYSKPMHHETMGTKVIEYDKDIKRIIHQYCPYIDIKDIQDIIVGCVERNPEISAMVQLIHSEVDADGIDYVMRDATFSGTSYGGFELGLLLRNLAVESYNGVDIVGIRPKGISVVDQYLVSKYFAYTQVIFNRHVAIFDTMAEMFSKILIQLDKSTYPSPKTLDSYIKMHNTNDEYLKFTDRAFWSQLDTIEKKDLELDGVIPQYAVKMYEKLLHYQEFDMASEGEVIITSNNKSDVARILKSSDIYGDLLSEKEDKLMLFHSRGFTSQVPELSFRRVLDKINLDTTPDEKFVKYNTARLQEGVAVIEKGKVPKLLVDDTRSIMSHLYGTKTYILREYLVK